MLPQRSALRDRRNHSPPQSSPTAGEVPEEAQRRLPGVHLGSTKKTVRHRRKGARRADGSVRSPSLVSAIRSILDIYIFIFLGLGLYILILYHKQYCHE